MADPYQLHLGTLGRQPQVQGVHTDIEPVTPDDATDIVGDNVGLYVQTGGDIVVTTLAGNVRTLTVDNFAWINLAVTRVHATGTTATGIHLLRP